MSRSFLEKTFKWLSTKGQTHEYKQIPYQMYKTNSYSVRIPCYLFKCVYIGWFTSLTGCQQHFFHCHLVFLLLFFLTTRNPNKLCCLFPMFTSHAFITQTKTCTTRLFVNWGILPVLAYKPLEWKSQVMFWRICCSTLWSVLWPHHTITDFEIAPPWLFQWQWSELRCCTFARFSCDQWSGLLICDDILRDLFQRQDEKSFR